MSVDSDFDAWVEAVAEGSQAAVPETTEAIYTVSDDGTPMIDARNFLIAILAAHGQYAAAFPTNDPDLTDKARAKLGIEAAATRWHSLISEVSENLIEAWEAGRLP